MTVEEMYDRFSRNKFKTKAMTDAWCYSYYEMWNVNTADSVETLDGKEFHAIGISRSDDPIKDYSYAGRWSVDAGTIKYMNKLASRCPLVVVFYVKFNPNAKKDWQSTEEHDAQPIMPDVYAPLFARSYDQRSHHWLRHMTGKNGRHFYLTEVESTVATDPTTIKIGERPWSLADYPEPKR